MIEIIAEIVMRMEAIKFADYEQPGIVFIDEVETHLHVSLQRQIMPFLTGFFPNVQFIVTTHSPFVLSSVDNAVVYDMETAELITQDENLWQYSYEALVEGYFEVEKFSLILKQKITEYKQLNSLDRLNKEQKK